MIKSELVSRIAAQNPHLYQRDVETIVVAILDTIADALARGDRVELRGFGAFSVKQRDARTGRNPRTGETVEVAATTVPAFRPGTGFRSAVAGEGAPAAITPGTPRRRPAPARSTASATNGTPAAASVALDGAVELSDADAAAVADEPAATKGKKGKAAKADKSAKDKDTAKDAGKDGKKGRKGKK